MLAVSENGRRAANASSTRSIRSSTSVMGLMQLDSFLELKGQTGGSTDEGHSQQFEITSFHHRIHRGTELRGEGDAKRPTSATHGEITVFMPLDSKTPLLLKSISTAVEYSEGIIVGRGCLLNNSDVVEYKDLYTLKVTRAVLTRVGYTANPILHGFGRQNIPMATPTSASLGPIAEVEMLYFGGITWTYGAISETVSANA